MTAHAAAAPPHMRAKASPEGAQYGVAAAPPSLRDLHRVERPREKLARLGSEALSDAELLALILRTGYAGCGVLELAEGVLKAFPSGLGQAGVGALESFKGLGAGRASSVVAAFELARRSLREDPRPALDSPLKVLERVPAEIRAGRKEHLLAFYLNARHKLLHWETVSVGTLSASLVHPREVFSPAVARAAAGVVAVHNHPSGDCRPSPEDREATRRLARAGELLGIPLLDHLVVAESGFFSFKESGLL